MAHVLSVLRREPVALKQHKGLRLGRLLHVEERVGLDPDVKAALQQALDRLADQAACRVSEVKVPGFEKAEGTNWTFLASDAAKRYAATIGKQPELYTSGFRRLVDRGKRITPRMMDEAKASRTQFQAAVADALRRVDVLVTPTMPLGRSALNGWAVLTAPFNLAGCPAISLPCGFLRDGTPIGMQLAAAANQDGVLLSLARMYETATDWHQRVPTGFGDA